MNSLKVLDVTLRDGGCVNNFNFGQRNMDQILEALEQSGVDIIELGYIDQNKGSTNGRTQYCNEQVIAKYFLRNKKPGTSYVAMMDYGKYDVDLLHPCSRQGIDGIRVAFHKKDRRNMISAGRMIMEKGYRFYIQPMITMRYSDAELLELIEDVNRELPDASGFYIVDSFGEMRQNDLIRILNLVDHNLLPSMPIGFHSHNNLQLSYSNAISLLQFPTNRDLMLDCSIMGMGKGAGNLNTELLLEHLNLYYGKSYRTEPLLHVIDAVINQIRAEFYWGYSMEYYLSSINHCTPSYAGHFYNKHMLPIDQVSALLGMIREDKKISFDQEYAEQLYLKYNAQKTADDVQTIDYLKSIFAGKKVLLIAPGRSVLSAEAKIRILLANQGILSVALNSWYNFETDYVFVSRLDAFSAAIAAKKKIITMSNICADRDAKALIIDYQKWVLVDGEVQDSSGIVSINLLKECGVSEFILAGFDGFHVNYSKNYYDKSMNHPITAEQAEKRNVYFRRFISNIQNSIPVTFLTPTLYEKDGSNNEQH